MKRLAEVLALVALLVFALGHLPGCTHLYRTKDRTEILCLADARGSLVPSAAACREAQGEYAQEPGNYSYTLYFVEFDDQGWPYAGSAYMERVLNEVKAKLDGRGRARHECVDGGARTVHVILFVHGWKHTAAYDDGNVQSFRRLVRESAAAECRGGSSRREVVGVYIGWRGRPAETPESIDFLDNLTFWDRKSTAIDVAQGNLREFFARVDAMVDRANARDRGSKPVRMLMVGHSFGGHILLTALGPSVLTNLAGVVDEDPGDADQCRHLQLRRDGDLIVLVNPAIEGTRFEPIFSVAKRWKVPCYKAPILVSVTSTGDWATGHFFPIGRWFSTWFEDYTSETQKEMDRHTLGHSDPLITHELGLRSDGRPFEGKPAPYGDCDRVWSTPSPDVEKAVAAEFRNARRFAERQQSGADSPEAPRSFCAGAVLVSRAGEAGRPPEWRAPVMNIRVQPSLVADHNAIYDPRFVSFLRELYMDNLEVSFRKR